MKLETENGNTIDSPSALDIERLVRALKEEGNAYAILSTRPGTYMQTILCDDGLELEYQEDDTDHHYQADRRLPREEVIVAMQQYASCDSEWRDAHTWQHLDLSTTSGSGCASAVVLLVVVAAGCITAAC